MIIRTFFTNLAILLITFATSVLTARILGPVGRGELALVLLYPQLITALTLMGGDRAIAVLAGRGELGRPMATIVKLTLLLSIPAIGLGYATVIWRVSDTHLADLATLYLTYAPAVIFFVFVTFLFNGTGNFIGYNLVRLGFYFVNIVFLFAIWVTAPMKSLDWVVLANLASGYGGLALAILLLRGFHYFPNLSNESAKTNDVKNVLRLALPFALPAALSQVSVSIYQIVLEHQLGVGPLGLYVVFFSYSRILAPVGSAIATDVFYQGITGENRDIARISRSSLIIYIFCALPLWAVAWWLIPLIYGQDFKVDLWVIAFLLISCIFALLADSLTEFLKGHKKVRADIWGRVIYLVTVGGLGWSLASLWGLIGIAFAMALADFLRYGYLLVHVGRLTGQVAGKFWRVTRSDIAALIGSGRMALVQVKKWRCRYISA